MNEIVFVEFPSILGKGRFLATAVGEALFEWTDSTGEVREASSLMKINIEPHPDDVSDVRILVEGWFEWKDENEVNCFTLFVIYNNAHFPKHPIKGRVVEFIKPHVPLDWIKNAFKAAQRKFHEATKSDKEEKTPLADD